MMLSKNLLQFRRSYSGINPTDYRRGRGGRSSFSGLVVTVFGATGYLGHHVVNKLGKIGSQVIVPYRGEAEEVRDMKLAGDLGQILFCPFHLDDECSIKKCVKYSNVVVNLIGRDWETPRFSFWDLHVIGCTRVARVCREAGVRRLIHAGALNAAPRPPGTILKDGSQFLATKSCGEEAVRDTFPEAVVVRPADIFGHGDRFICYLSGLFRHQVKWMPLYKGGEATEKQPVFVEDVAAGIVNACLDPKTNGKVYQAIGPYRYQLSELVDWFHRLMRKTWDEWGYRRYDIALDPLFRLRVSLLSLYTYYRKWPLLNLHWEKIEREGISDSTCDNLLTLEDLGVKLTPIEDIAPWVLRQYRLHSYYDFQDEVEQFDPPAPPKRVCKKEEEEPPAPTEPDNGGEDDGEKKKNEEEKCEEDKDKVELVKV